MGSTEEADHKAVTTLDKFTCSLFGDSKAQTVNDARYNLFTQGKFGEDCLPPNKDALALHIDRCNYISFIWRRCLNQEIGAPDFRNHGWEVDESGKVSVKWLSGLPAMDNILESSSCKCKPVVSLNNVVARKKTWNAQSSASAVIAKIRNIPMPMKMTMIFTRRTLKWTILTSND